MGESIPTLLEVAMADDFKHEIKEAVASGGIGAALTALWDRYAKKKTDEVIDDTYRQHFAVIVAQLPEPARTRINAHYQKAKAEFVENKFVKLLTKAGEGRSELGHMRYLT